MSQPTYGGSIPYLVIDIDDDSRIILIDALSRVHAGVMDYGGFELAVKNLPNSVEFDSVYNELQHWFLDDNIRLKSAPYRQMQERLFSRLIDALRDADSKAVLEITLLSDRSASPTNPLGPLWGHVALFVAVDAIAISFSAPDYEPAFFIFEPLYCAVLLSASASWQLLFKSHHVSE